MFAILVKHNLMREDHFRSDPELMATSDKEFRPIHCEMVRQKLLHDFFEPSSLPSNINKIPADLKHQNSSVKTSSSIQEILEKFEDFQINAKEKKKKEEEEKNDELFDEIENDEESVRRDSGIGSSLEDEPRRYSITETVFEGRLNITRTQSTRSLNRPKKKKRMERRGSAYDHMLFDLDLES